MTDKKLPTHLLHPNGQHSVCGVPVKNTKVRNGRLVECGPILTLACKTTCRACRRTFAWWRASRRSIETDETEHGERLPEGGYLVQPMTVVFPPVMNGPTGLRGDPG